MNGVLDGRGAGVLHDIPQQDLLEARGVVQKIRFAQRERGHLFEITAVDVLAQSYRGNGDLPRLRFAGERHAVALFGDAVREQHDVLVDGVHGQDAAVRFLERRRDLRAAVRRDAGHHTFDQAALFGPPDGHGPVERIVEDEHANQVDGP